MHRNHHAMSGVTHSLNIRIPYAHSDQMGVVYYANYFIYFEMARCELLRSAGTPYSEMERQGVMLPVLEAHCTYAKGARFDEQITVETTCAELRGTRLRIEYRITRGADLIATGYTVHACVSPDGRVLRPPESVRQLVNSAGTP
jgi:acyl-CoA thioester hydrolase